MKVNQKENDSLKFLIFISGSVRPNYQIPTSQVKPQCLDYISESCHSVLQRELKHLSVSKTMFISSA